MFARIMSAAERAVQSGVEEGLLVRADPVELDALGDEPLSSPGGRGVEGIADEPPPRVEPVVEASPPRGEPAREKPAAPPKAAPRLPHVPLFSDLDREAFLELTAAMELHRVSKGQAVIREGEEGASFFVVASGQFAVAKRDDSGRAIPLARLGAGDFFGEMALLSGASRAATVTAEEEGEVLEFRAEVLLDVAGRHPHLAQSLRRFYRQRLLGNAMAASPIFRPFQRVERKLIVERFRTREVREGEAIVREGQPSDGLYVVLEGAVDVV
jgi:CRP-like cAMP-binding protein